ncbi:MAG: hypothetical protein Q8916_13965 [Bacteroidota bacterium]|nr:hypothetical protein [Bacteroidota bacterium]MDP4231500.1 hypothetical protein [Bacteroidota bacterium]MDP4237122.1 hypothetical protein [Bacteroidota bacterium]
MSTPHTAHRLSLMEFAQTRLGISLWSKLEEIFEAVQSGKRKILIRSCNGAGKTCALAAICNWKLKTTEDSIVITTASSHTQVKRNLWGEIRKQAKYGTLYGKGQVRESFIKLTDKHYGIGISPAVKENAQGFHAERMLVVVDEATGVSREIINALFGNATGSDAQIILAYNPLDTDSFVYEAEQNNDWHVITISAFDHPNVIEGKDLIKGAVSAHWIADMLPTWSYEVEKGSPDSFEFGGKTWRKTSQVASRIFGEWSLDGGEGFIPMYLVKRSCALAEMRGDKAMGIDIARSGTDETIFAFFDGNTQLPFHSMRTKDLVEIAHAIEGYYHAGWKIIALDDTGVGAGVTDILKSNGIPCHPVNFASAASVLQKLPYRQIANTRAEMYFALDEELKKKQIKLLDDRKLHQEITALRLRQSENREAYLLEDKSDLVRRLGRSPDRADATALARYGLRLEGKRQEQQWKRYLM